MDKDMPLVPGALGDFAAGERTEPETPEETLHEGDFAAGERTEPETPEEKLEEGLHGDFAAGERAEPLTPEDETPGSFAETNA